MGRKKEGESFPLTAAFLAAVAQRSLAEECVLKVWSIPTPGLISKKNISKKLIFLNSVS
jgi:hypothetical protein